MNKVILMGRLTKDPETRQAGETIVTRFSLAVDRRRKTDVGQAADFPSIVAFGKTAEFINKYFHKLYLVFIIIKNKKIAIIFVIEV